MRIRRKSNRCLNCASTLDGVYNYCPICGQENNDNNISFGTLFKDFFSNYISLDTRIGRSIVPFFFKPGHLTNKFNEGYRVSFVHPIRLYLIVSLFYFFTFHLLSLAVIEKQEEERIGQKVGLDRIEGIPKKTADRLNEILDDDVIEEINDNLDENNVEAFLKVLDDKTKEKILNKLDSNDLSVFKNAGLNLDSIKKVVPEAITVKIGDKSDSIFLDKDSIFTKKDSPLSVPVSNWDMVEKYKDDREVTSKMLFDSLNHEGASNFKRYLWKQFIRVRKSDNRTLANYVVDNLPIMMLFLLPIFAFLLKVFYRRSKTLYIKHVVHALHIHSFAYLLYGISILLIIYVVEDETAQNWVEFISFVTVSTYVYISFLKVYKQKPFKTLIKFNMIGFIYGFCIMLFFALELFISFLSY